jgi:uncharacterized protein (DUF1778 family)
MGAPAAEDRSARDTISLRVPRQTRELIDSAAASIGKSRTEFVLDSARQQAVDVLLDQRLFSVDAEQHETFLHALDNPPQPSERLKALMRKAAAW